MKENRALLYCCPFIPLLSSGPCRAECGHPAQLIHPQPSKGQKQNKVPGKRDTRDKSGRSEPWLRVKLTTASKIGKAAGQSPDLLPGLGGLLSFFWAFLCRAVEQNYEPEGSCEETELLGMQRP